MYDCYRENSGKTRCFRPCDPVSPRRDLQKQARFTFELSLRRRSLVLSEVLSHSDKRRLPKRERVGALVCCCSLSPGEEPHLWTRGGLAQARRARLSERSKNLPRPLSQSRLSESLQLKRGLPSHLSEGF
ncbi:hypothetical protein DEO72_LG5g2651 [Vigna unguiculata]|uniref:Uncharacterized protein n=1 Tax=Vigna unguiculata TaxID=3917 RepID=A0A4D6M101_VIGUN|nr:hypothetical protein DEO72_LG5g2651 [Vigna unguiculata]